MWRFQEKPPQWLVAGMGHPTPPWYINTHIYREGLLRSPPSMQHVVPRPQLGISAISVEVPFTRLHNFDAPFWGYALEAPLFGIRSEWLRMHGLSTERPMQWLSSPAAFGCPLWHTMSTTFHVRKPLPPMSRPTLRSRRPSSTWAFEWRQRKPNRPILNKKSWASSFNIKNKLSRLPHAHNGPAGYPPSYKRSWTATTWTQILPTALLVSSCSCRRPPLDRLVKPHWLQSMLVQPIRPLNHTTCWLTPYEPPSNVPYPDIHSPIRALYQSGAYEHCVHWCLFPARWPQV